MKVDMKKNKKVKWELYDLQKDESETTDLAAQHPELIKRFDRIVQRKHQPSHVAAWEFVE